MSGVDGNFIAAERQTYVMIKIKIGEFSEADEDNGSEREILTSNFRNCGVFMTRPMLVLLLLWLVLLLWLSSDGVGEAQQLPPLVLFIDSS